jgi:hypothetical protein
MGHTDSSGSDSYNLDLSRRRAESVKGYLVMRGVRGARVATIGYGEQYPRADNTTAEGRRSTAGSRSASPRSARKTPPRRGADRPFAQRRRRPVPARGRPLSSGDWPRSARRGRPAGATAAAVDRRARDQHPERPRVALVEAQRLAERIADRGPASRAISVAAAMSHSNPSAASPAGRRGRRRPSRS